MKFVKGISLYLIYPVVMLAIGFWAGVETMHFFYPGEQKQYAVQEAQLTENSPSLETEQALETESVSMEDASEAAVSMETLSVDTEYVLEETDIVNGSVVETVWKLPDKYVGLNREQFLEAMETYEAFPPLSELERGFVNLEVLSFSRERVVVQMNYQYVQPGTGFYLAVRDNEVVVYLEDMETVYIYTGIELKALPKDMQQEIIQMIWIEDEENLYNLLENYSS